MMRRSTLIALVTMLLWSLPFALNAQSKIAEKGEEEGEETPIVLVARTKAELFLRTQPDIISTVIGSVPENGYVLAIARNEDNTWLQVQYQGGFGWISANWVEVSGDINTLTTEISNSNVTLTAVVPARYTRILVHTLPSDSSRIVGYLVANVEMEILAADPGYEWGLINYNGYEGWVDLDDVSLRGGSRFTLPQFETVRDTTMTVETLSNVSLRANPTALSPRLGIVPQGVRLQATGRTADNTWYVVAYGDRIGWVNDLYLSITPGQGEAPFEALPVVETLKTDGRLTATASFRIVSYRNAPLDYARIMGTIGLNQSVDIVKVDPSQRWGQININNNLYWVNLAQMNLNGDPSTLPVWVDPSDLVDIPQFSLQQRATVHSVQRYFGDVVGMIDFLEAGAESPIAVCALLENDYRPYYPISAAFIEVPELASLILDINDVTGTLNAVLSDWLTACSTNTLANHPSLESWIQTVQFASEQVASIEWRLAVLNAR